MGEGAQPAAPHGENLATNNARVQLHPRFPGTAGSGRYGLRSASWWATLSRLQVPVRHRGDIEGIFVFRKYLQRCWQILQFGSVLMELQASAVIQAWRPRLGSECLVPPAQRFQKNQSRTSDKTIRNALSMLAMRTPHKFSLIFGLSPFQKRPHACRV